jgi:hypothetical protein
MRVRMRIKRRFCQWIHVGCSAVAHLAPVPATATATATAIATVATEWIVGVGTVDGVFLSQKTQGGDGLRAQPENPEQSKRGCWPFNRGQIRTGLQLLICGNNSACKKYKIKLNKPPIQCIGNPR